MVSNALKMELLCEVKEIAMAKLVVKRTKPAFDKERAAAAAAKKKYAAEVFEEYYFLAGSIEGFPARKGVLDTMPSVRALNSLNKMVLAGFWLPAKIKAKVGKAYAWAYLEAVTPQPVYEALPNMTFTESQWVLENLPESK